MKYGLYTRKQIWRKYIFDNSYFLNDDENNPIKSNNIQKKEKKVRFKNEVYLTLIPTRKELEKLKYIVVINNIENNNENKKKNLKFNSVPRFYKFI